MMGTERNFLFSMRNKAMRRFRLATVFLIVFLVLAVLPFENVWFLPQTVKANPTYEDFTTFTEVDPNSHISKTSTRITFSGLLHEESAYVYIDKEEGHFGEDFDHLFDVELTGSGGTQDVYVGVWGLWVTKQADDNADEKENADANHEGLTVVFVWDISASTLMIFLREINDGTIYSDYCNTLSKDTRYYIRIKRDDDFGDYGRAYCDVYTSALDRTNEENAVWNGVLDLHSREDYRYLYGLQSRTGAVDWGNIDGFVENLDLQEEGIEKTFTLSETFTLLDSKTVAKEKLTVITETITITPQTIKRIEKIVTMTETVTISEQHTVPTVPGPPVGPPVGPPAGWQIPRIFLIVDRPNVVYATLYSCIYQTIHVEAWLNITNQSPRTQVTLYYTLTDQDTNKTIIPVTEGQAYHIEQATTTTVQLDLDLPVSRNFEDQHYLLKAWLNDGIYDFSEQEFEIVVDKAPLLEMLRNTAIFSIGCLGVVIASYLVYDEEKKKRKKKAS